MKAETKYFDKYLSWLSFNHRVLMEADDEGLCLAERIQFLAIYASNLDEFFRMKLGTLKKLAQLGKRNAKEYFQVNPKKTLVKISETLDLHNEEFQHLWYSKLMPLMPRAGIQLVHTDLLVAEQQRADHYFRSNVLSFLRPFWLNELPAGQLETENIPYLLVALGQSG